MIGQARKFLVALDFSTAQEQTVLTELFLGKGWEVWHWLADLWLLSNVPEDVTASNVTELARSFPGLRLRKLVVMQIDGDPVFWGAITKDAWPWMRNNWGVVDPTGIPNKPAAT